MKLLFDNFGGIIPKLDAESLPMQAAQTAQNVDLTGGKLAPISVTGTVVAQHNGTTLNKEIRDSEWFTISKPSAPTATRYMLFNLAVASFDVRMHVWVTYEDAAGEFQTVHWVNENMDRISSFKHSDAGFTVSYKSSDTHNRTFVKGRLYYVYGPLYQLYINGSYLPSEAAYTDPIIPTQTVPLSYGGTQFADLQVVDVRGPVFNREIFQVDHDLEWTLPKVNIDLTVDMNYTIPKRRFFYYLQTNVNTRGDEGPPSELSAQYVQVPGSIFSVATSSKAKLYRSETGGDDFYLLDDVTGTYTDNRLYPQAIKVPPSGNYPAASAQVGSIVHPAHFAACFYNNTSDPTNPKYEVWLSDYYRHWAWPEEYVVPFESPILALSLAGSNIIVFTEEKVYMLAGSDPSAMPKYEVTGTRPLLNPLGFVRVNGVTYYVSEDGLVALSGADSRLVTKDHYTRTQWAALNPANMKASAADDSVFLTGGAVGLRIDLQEELARVSTYTALSGVAYTWKSKVIATPSAWRPNAARVKADNYPVTLKLYREGTLVATKSITGEEPMRLAKFKPARRWEVEFSGNYQIEEAIVASSMAEVGGG